MLNSGNSPCVCHRKLMINNQYPFPLKHMAKKSLVLKNVFSIPCWLLFGHIYHPLREIELYEKISMSSNGADMA